MTGTPGSTGTTYRIRYSSRNAIWIRLRAPVVGRKSATPQRSGSRAVVVAQLLHTWLQCVFLADVVAAMSKRQSILVVDDEPNILLSLQFLMKNAGYEVRVAKDGDEALAELERGVPDLVLLDVMMPRRDGFEVCQKIRANPQWKTVRVIMLTARGRPIEREKGMALGADDYIIKPFSTKAVISRVEALLGASDKTSADKA